MRTPSLYPRLTAICLTLSALVCQTAGASTLTVNPDTGLLSIDNDVFASSVVWRGVTISAGSIIGGVREYFVRGDFTVNDDDAVTATLGSAAGVRFVVGNDAVIAEGAFFNFSGLGTHGRAGGGNAGAGGSAGLGVAIANGGAVASEVPEVLVVEAVPEARLFWNPEHRVPPVVTVC